ncbi:MAG: ribosomal L7Ae/L30e/S12e/Gadd45 family protein [Candidatus Aenigmarchaeota archaeon]|nr:ribosomal L7Ae/L30e/S12e/Gadd45 family protein [Candidatus Aenigmarchaeota archaeon]
MKEEFIIGTREVMKAIKDDKIERVVLASNAPESIKDMVKKIAEEKGIIVEEDGDELKLATKVGKPFPIATVGYLKGEEEE